jgi:serine/threonine protein kinase
MLHALRVTRRALVDPRAPDLLRLPAVAQSEEVGELRRGTVLAGKYELHSVLGRGGMGVVFRGKHLGIDRPIAIKVLRRELVSNPTLAKRFVREAKAAATLQHPNVVDVLDYGVDADGTAFQVLELLQGESLGEHLARKGTISIATALSLVLPVIHALAVAHTRGVVHRDLKPDNVFLARNVHGRIVPKLLDFGIAKLLPKDGGTSSTLSTRAGAAIGTPAYMSPEQARGTADVGTTTDVWAIGVILFECIAGRIPFEAETGSILMARIIMEQAPSLATVAPDVPKAIVDAIDRALAAKSEDRWPTMEAFADALRNAAVASDISVPPADASDSAPMSLPPPRAEEDTTLEREDPISSGDGEPDVDVHPATRVAAQRTPTAPTMPGVVSPTHTPTPTAPRRAAASSLSLEETPPARRVPIVPFVAVSLVLAALVLLGLWMREPPVTAARDAPVTRAEVSAPPAPLAPAPVVEPAPLPPIEAPEPVAVEIALPPAPPAVGSTTPRRRGSTRDVPADEATHAPTTAPRGEPGSRLPELEDW